MGRPGRMDGSSTAAQSGDVYEKQHDGETESHGGDR